MSPSGAEIGNVLYPVDNVATATQFYGECLGLEVQFTDGNRFAGLQAGRTTLALAGPDEDITAGIAAASFKVSNVDATVDGVVESGGELVRPVQYGPHEERAVVRDPWGNTLVVYSPVG